MNNVHPIFQNIIKQHAPVLFEKPVLPMQYRGYTIEEDHDYNPYSRQIMYMLYPTEQGVQHDADGDSEGYRYTGNCKWTDDVEEAKAMIDDILYESFDFEKFSDVVPLKPGEQKRAWVMAVFKKGMHKAVAFTTESFHSALRFSIMFNAVYFESKEHPNSEYL
jgi:hypothetical protein